ncbi:ETS translocation variant 4-like isoform X1 [Pomacea canaliculata]|uniref:ETS translocation variant 4-like isoform X1 n=2 Tax=Pomacea canaliculata TaxID=400727 RepID=UPI000D7364C1|nr:ETS translocation variant 4-like isoform X1 [Pomacea canaliculata]
MLTISTHHTPSASPGSDVPNLTELQTIDITSLITTSTNMCLPGSVGDSPCSDMRTFSSRHSSSASPHSPQSVYEDELSDIQDILQRCAPGSSDDDDDTSVVLDFEDLAFLDKFSRTSEMVTVMDRCDEYHQPLPSDSGYSLHYCNNNSANSYYSTYPSWAHPNYDVYHRPHLNGHTTFPPTPSPSPGPRPIDSRTPRTTNVSDVDDEDEEDDEYKPYCDSKRGAKKNLLWKFLLWVLENRADLAEWTDITRGTFKFVDTANVSKMWGLRKHKKDMTFEKLSRGIRHYYKRGLMERQANTRLVYKFNWDKVPKKYRKA